MTADRTADPTFSIAADLLEYGEIRPETLQAARAVVTSQLRSEIPADVRADIRRAVEQEGWDMPDWLKP